MNPRTKYWIFVILGFLVVATVFLYQQGYLGQSKEMFEVAAATSDTAAATTTSPTSTVEVTSNEEVVAMPLKDRLALYLSAFAEPATYQCQANQWCDSVKPLVKYFLMSNQLPDKLLPSTGLPLNFVVRGPAAYTLGKTLDSFTVAFYMNIAEIDPTAENIVFLNIPAETPNLIKFYMSGVTEADSTISTSKVAVNVDLGDIQDRDDTPATYTWILNDKNVITKQNTLIAFTYDKQKGSLGFYDGKTVTYKNVGALSINLGVSEMEMNTNQNMNANLIAFTYYNTPLLQADLDKLAKYCEQHASGYALQVRAKEQLADEVRDLMGMIQTGEDTIKQLLAKINSTTCPSADAAANPESATVPPKWLIKMGAATDGISTVELGKCSPLTIKKFGEALKAAASTSSTASTASSSGAATTTTTTTTTTSGGVRKVVYPDSVTSSTVAQGVPGVNVTNPSSNSTTTGTQQQQQSSSSNTPATTTTVMSSLPTASQDPQFWQQFFDFMKNQQAKNDTMTTETTNLNNAYEQLRKEVSTDKTQPGNLLFQPTVQDPAKPSEPAPTVETKSWWDNIVDIFIN